MRIGFVFNQQTVYPSWSAPFIPGAGNYIQWKLGGEIPGGLYQVQEVVWQLDGSVHVLVMLNYVRA